jgi:hypothetical protein
MRGADIIIHFIGAVLYSYFYLIYGTMVIHYFMAHRPLFNMQNGTSRKALQ